MFSSARSLCPNDEVGFQGRHPILVRTEAFLEIGPRAEGAVPGAFSDDGVCVKRGEKGKRLEFRARGPVYVYRIPAQGLELFQEFRGCCVGLLFEKLFLDFCLAEGVRTEMQKKEEDEKSKMWIRF